MTDDHKKLVEAFDKLYEDGLDDYWLTLTQSKQQVAAVRAAIESLSEQLERAEAELKKAREREDAIYRYLSDKKTDAVMAVVTEMSLAAQLRAARKESHE